MFHSSLIFFCKQIKMMQNWYVKFFHLHAKRTYLPHLWMQKDVTTQF